MKLGKLNKVLAAVLAISLSAPVTAAAAPTKETAAVESEAGTEGNTQEPQTEEETKETKEDKGADEIVIQEGEDPVENEDKDKKDKEQEEENEVVILDGSGNGEQVIDSNESLIQSQEIVVPPTVKDTFRFMMVKKEYAVVKRMDVSIFEEKDEKSRKVGNIERLGLVYILKDEDDWVYVESGQVRGFIKKEKLITGEKAEKYAKRTGESKMTTAKVLVAPLENEAIAYTKTTVYKTVVEKKYGIARKALDILDSIPDEEVLAEELLEEEEDEIGVEEIEPETVGTLEEGGLCYILSDAKDGWVFVESEDVRGFVKKSQLLRGNKAKEQVKEREEETFALAEQLIEPEENKACYYTLTSVQEASVSSMIRASMIQYAEQFIGNPYVWGGTSLTNGADCSGFVQSIYSEFGYSLPRVAEDQAQVGTKIPVESAQPGDLIFYARNGYIYHVVMSLGNGETIEAQSSATGIVYGTVNYDNAVWATRIIKEEDTKVLDQIKENGLASDYYNEYTTAEGYSYGELLGNFKLTSYCNCPICCGVWSGGPTASGAMPIEGRTVAMAGVPFGTKLIINGLVYTVEDRGTPYGHVDVYKNSHDEAVVFGVQYADVYLVKE